MDVRSHLVAHLREQADWRVHKAEEYPDDQRNARSAAALRDLADTIEALPSDDTDLRVLAAIREPYGLDVFTPGEEARHLIRLHGFHGRGDPDPARVFLRCLVEAEAADAAERDHEES